VPPASSISRRISARLWLDSRSSTMTSPGRSVGTSTCPT
jgi:hypothetical protein